MLKRWYIVFFLVLLVCAVVGVSHAQDDGATPPSGTVEKKAAESAEDLVADPDAETKPAIKKEAKKKAKETKAKKKPKKSVEGEADDASGREAARDEKGTDPSEVPGLLDLTDAEFKYRRIPNIKLERPAPATADRDLKDSPAGDGKAVKAKGKDSESGGRTSDTVAKVILLLIIIAIFVLYRLRAGKGQSRVLRRYPK